MNSLPEQFSAARLTQLDNGFNLMRSLGDQALDRTSRVLALQLDASRAAVEQSSSAMRQLLAARDPRDLLALGSQSQQHLRTMFDYGRELFSIATAGMSVPALGVNAQGAATAAAAPMPAPAPAPARRRPNKPHPRPSSASAPIRPRSPPLPPSRRPKRWQPRLPHRPASSCRPTPPPRTASPSSPPISSRSRRRR